MEKILKITSCLDCPFHEVINDPDPHDSFNIDDMAVVCKKTIREPNFNSEYAADRQKYKPISVGDRPYQIKREYIKIPKWCPL